METKSLFPTFEKIYRRIPASFFEVCGFALLELMIGLLLISQFTVLLWREDRHGNLFFATGILLVLFALLYIGFCLLRGDDKRGSSRLLVTDIAFFFFLVWCGISVAFSPNPAYSFWGSVYRKEGFITYLIYAAVLISARAVHSPRYQRILLWSLGGVGCLLSAFTFIASEPTWKWILADCGIFLGWEMIAEYNSVFFNLNHLAYFLTMAIPALAGMFLFGKRTGQKLLALFLFTFAAVVLMRNNTLGCILAVAFSLVFLCILLFLYDRKLVRWGIILLMIDVLVVLTVPRVNATISGDFQEIYDALNHSAETVTNTSVRLQMWQQSLQQIAKTPIFGVGLEGGGSITFWGGNDRPHNEYIQYTLFTGIPGGLAYLTALISLFVCCMRKLKKLPVEALTLGTMVFGYAASAFVGNSMYYTTVYFAAVLGLLMGAVQSVGQDPGCGKLVGKRCRRGESVLSKK